MNLAFPFGIMHGVAAAVDDDDYVEQLIELVLFTRPGERVNRPDFGCGVDYLVFQPNDPQMMAAAQYMIQSELQRFVADVASIASIEVAGQENALSITVEYVNLLTQTSHKATFSR